MWSLWYGVIFLWTLGQLISFMLEGTSGLMATTLTSDITATATYIPIASASGLPSSDTRIFVEDEEIRYDSIQSGADANCPSPPCLVLSSDDRGLNGTDADAHASGTKLLWETGGLLNQVVGFRVGNVDTVLGAIPFVVQNLFAIGKFVAKLVMWDWSIFSGNAVYVKYILFYPLSGAMVVAVIGLFREAYSTILGR
ncbi:MAG: hypothetical protein QW838_05880 [Candidatus Nitrosotenuis sp.]